MVKLRLQVVQQIIFPSQLLMSLKMIEYHRGVLMHIIILLLSQSQIYESWFRYDSSI